MFWDPGMPIHFDPQLDCWHVFKHADVSRLLADTAVFSSSYGLTPEQRQQMNPLLEGMWAADDPRHRDLRNAVREPFRASVLAQLRPKIEEIATERIDEVIAAGTGRVEAVTALARPLPSRVICYVLGLDLTYAARVHAWMDEQYQVSSTTHTMPPQQDMREFFGDLLVERRANPQTGLLDELLAAQGAGYTVDGQPLSDQDLIGYCAMLLSAGVDTTSASLSNAFLFLTDYGHWDTLREDPSLIPGAVEESMRWYPAFPGIRRRVISDTEFDGQVIPAGQWVTGWLPAANRDPQKFRDPDRFDIRRKPNPELAFGAATHHCLGAPLARLEQQIMLEHMVRRLPGLRRDPGMPLERRMWLVDNLECAHFTFDLGRAAQGEGT
jgi:cytochrome P450